MQTILNEKENTEKKANMAKILNQKEIWKDQIWGKSWTQKRIWKNKNEENPETKRKYENNKYEKNFEPKKENRKKMHKRNKKCLSKVEKFCQQIRQGLISFAHCVIGAFISTQIIWTWKTSYSYCRILLPGEIIWWKILYIWYMS